LEKELNSSTRIERKRKALEYFRSHLLSSSSGKHIGKIILFGSLATDDIRAESDVDVLILALDNLNAVEDAAADASLDTGLEIGESVEPLVYCVDEWRYPSSYFLYRIACNGEEIYSMDETQIRKEESRSYRDLAAEYIEGSNHCLRGGHFRLAVDASYNAAELCAKGLLLFKLDELPSSHGGVVIKFSELYIKQGLVSRNLGRALNKALALRNKSHYDRHSLIGSTEADEVQKLAEEMAALLDKELDK
jgi:uncharacterized protein (UPF0332 family)/predicted nucleotidyltransferase